jgi:translation initiation factor 2-alpha kinase 4
MTTYSAEPICDDVRATLPLELVVITFDSKYYSTAAGSLTHHVRFTNPITDPTSGKKKLRALEPELHRLVSIRHPHLLSLYAIKLTIPIGERNARLALLLDQSPALNLADVLADADSLKEEKATVSLRSQRSTFIF